MILIKAQGEKAKIVRNKKNIQLRILPLITERKKISSFPINLKKNFF
tara:strand:+ start:50 stop:190 length:141 start_codon:yes stop_codon:yes gene_type:complete